MAYSPPELNVWLKRSYLRSAAALFKKENVASPLDLLSSPEVRLNVRNEMSKLQSMKFDQAIEALSIASGMLFCLELS